MNPEKEIHMSEAEEALETVRLTLLKPGSTFRFPDPFAALDTIRSELASLRTQLEDVQRGARENHEAWGEKFRALQGLHQATVADWQDAKRQLQEERERAAMDKRELEYAAAEIDRQGKRGDRNYTDAMDYAAVLAKTEAELRQAQEALRLADEVVGGIATDNGQGVWFVGDHMALRIWDYQRARAALTPNPSTEQEDADASR